MQRLAGTLPPEWTAMHKLQWLSISQNMINGVSHALLLILVGCGWGHTGCLCVVRMRHIQCIETRRMRLLMHRQGKAAGGA